MPLLGKKLFHLAKPLTTIDLSGSVFVVKHTGECFQSRKDYNRRIQLYSEKVWTCQCTGHINLTHEEAWKSEQDARQLLKKNYPEYLEKPVLEIIHHSTAPLDSLIDQSYIKVNTMFFPGDHVQFKVKNCGRIIKGRVLMIDDGTESENRLSPCSDKENADSSLVSNSNEGSPRKYPLKFLPYKYNIRLLEEDKIISAVPAEDLVRCERPPTKDMLRLFIRAHAIRHGPNQMGPWMVDGKLVKKYGLPNKPNKSLPTSPSTMNASKDVSSESKGSAKKRQSSVASLGGDEQKGVLRHKKLKVDSSTVSSPPTNHQATLHNYSKQPGSKGVGVSKKSTTSKKVLKQNGVVKKKVNGKILINLEDDSDSDVTVIITPESKPAPKLAQVVQMPCVSPELDHSYSSPKKKAVTVTSATPIGASAVSGEKRKLAGLVNQGKLSATTSRKLEFEPYVVLSQVKSPAKSVGGKKEVELKVRQKATIGQKSLLKRKSSSTSTSLSGKKVEGEKKKKKTEITNTEKPKSLMKSQQVSSPKKHLVLQIKKLNPSLPKKLKQITLFDMRSVKKSKVSSSSGGLSTVGGGDSRNGGQKSSGKSPNKLLTGSSSKKFSTPGEKAEGSGKSSSGNDVTVAGNSVVDSNGKLKLIRKRKNLCPVKPIPPSQLATMIETIKVKLETKHFSNIPRAIDQLHLTLTAQEIENLPEIVKEKLQRRIKYKENQAKRAAMTPEELLEFTKRQRRRKKLSENVKVVEEEKKVPPPPPRSMEDKNVTDLKPLPAPQLVPTPDGVPNELYGHVVMIVEFINCYCGLLMPEESYPVQTDLLMKAISNGNEGFGYLSRILLILLQTLLQDKIAEDYKELGVRLSDLPININTASELVRLCLRRHDEDEDKETDEMAPAADDEGAEFDEVLALLENSELYELIPQKKLEIMAGLCHRIMNSYSVQEYMEQKQNTSRLLWKEMLEVKKSEKAKLEGDEKKKVDKTEANEKVPTVALETKEIGAANETKPVAVAEEKDGNKSLIEPVNNLPEANVASDNIKKKKVAKSHLLSAIKCRRHALAAKQKEREKRLKAAEKLAMTSEARSMLKACFAARHDAHTTLRQTPLGYDRNHTRYWLFSHGTLGLYMEKGWVGDSVEYCVLATKETKAEGTEETQVGDSDDEPLANTQKRVNIDSVPVVCQNLWFHYRTLNEVDELMQSLTPLGVREGHLLLKLQKKYNEIQTSFSRKRNPKYCIKESKGEEELLAAFKKELTETEVRVRKGLLGGVPNLPQWEHRLNSAETIQELTHCLLETQANVLPRFLQGIMHVNESNVEFQKRSEDGDDDDSGEKLQRWIDAVENCPTMSRLHVLLGVLDACIKWEKSTENAKCKICRRNNEDLVLILCDNCNLAFHLMCLRPALHKIPDGEWMCPACQPTTNRHNDRVEKLQKRQGEEETEYTTPPANSQQSGGRSLRSSARIRSSQGDVQESADGHVRRSRPPPKQRWVEESSESEEDEEESVSVESDGSTTEECCMCGGDEDVVTCVKCHLGYHTFCHLPQMHNKPRGKWICSSCQSGKKPKSLQSARRKWQQWKIPSSSSSPSKSRPSSIGRRSRSESSARDAKFVQNITTRLQQRITEAASDSVTLPKISTREARALRRALGQDEQ